MSEMWTIFASQDPIGATVNLVIAAVFLTGLFDVIVARLQLGRDRATIRSARVALADADLIASAPDKVLSELKIPPTSLLGKRVSRVIQLRDAGVGYRGVLQQLTLERIGNYGSHARFIASILTMLGLVGTVVGMSMAMLKISGAFTTATSVQALDELTHALGGTLEGMKTAFACTLAGLSGAVILASFNHILRRRQSAVVRELEEFVTCELLPALERVDPDADGASKAFATVLSDAAEKLTRLSDSVLSASERYNSSGAQMERTAVTLREAVAHLAGQTVAVAEQQAALDQRLAAIEESIKANRALQESIVTHNTELTRFIDNSTQHLQIALKQLLTDVNTHYRDGIVGHVEESQKKLTGVISDNTTRLTAVISDNTTRFSELLGQHSIRLQSFSDIVLDMYANGSKSRVKEGQA
jgi:biopolymer transport protein ExbB/TolQ